jgi:hypothetical protein
MLVRVIARLCPGWVRVVVGPGVGLINGGSEQDWPEDWLPAASRAPNAELWWVGWTMDPPQLEPIPRGVPRGEPEPG